MANIERIAMRRRFGLMLCASAFLVWQVPMMDFSEALAAGDDIIKTIISLAGFAVWIVTLLMLVGPWRPFKQDAKVEAALNDELTRANRAKAFIAGYVVMLVAAAGLFALTHFEPHFEGVGGMDAAHIILVLGVAIPLYAFAFLERG